MEGESKSMRMMMTGGSNVHLLQTVWKGKLKLFVDLGFGQNDFFFFAIGPLCDSNKSYVK